MASFIFLPTSNLMAVSKKNFTYGKPAFTDQALLSTYLPYPPA
jgi:hypothetical protein